jgi:hypothetical protein
MSTQHSRQRPRRTHVIVAIGVNARKGTPVLLQALSRLFATYTHQLFERCATALIEFEAVINKGRIADPCVQHLYSRYGRHSSAVEQLFRKQQVLGSNPSVGSTNPRTIRSAGTPRDPLGRGR